MYEPSRAKSVVRMGGNRAGYPRSSRNEALDIQLAGHLSALLAVTDELGLDEASARIAGQVERLRGAQPARAVLHGAPDTAAALHQRAHDLAARALLVAASRADTTAAILAAERMDAHAAALDSMDLAGAH